MDPRAGAARRRLRLLHVSHLLARVSPPPLRSEEHTSELQSPCNLVCRLLLEKKTCSLLSHCRHRSGVTVRETRKEAKSENEMVKVSGMKSSLAWPSRKTVGSKTTMVVMVDTN